MKTYHVNRIENNAINNQNILHDTVWGKANKLNEFQYPWEEDEKPDMEFMALCDQDYFFFKFEVNGEAPLSYVDKNHKMEVVDSDRVEIFFRKNDALNPYYCLELDAVGRVLDYKTSYYRKFSYDWQWPANNHLKIFVKRENNGYVVAGRISIESLAGLGLINNSKLEAGLFRGRCMRLPDNGNEADLKWISWVKPDSETPDFHIPSAFGILELQST